MPRTIPHLPSIENGGCPPLVIFGTGMSQSLAPGVSKLLEDCSRVATQLGCTTRVNLADNNNDLRFYEWAEEICGQLAARGDQVPKLTLARECGMVSTPSWTSQTAVGSPRHRVLARFARERRLKAIWTVNWDCLFESALENVGISGDAEDSNLPWPTRYQVFVTTNDQSRVKSDRDVKVYKPHGCIRALTEADHAQKAGRLDDAQRKMDRFIVTKTDLETLGPNDRNANDRELFYGTLRVQLPEVSFIVLGWRLVEESWHIFLDRLSPELKQNSQEDKLTVIDIDFQSSHERLAQYYGVTQEQCHIRVDRSGIGITVDKLMLWIQALYALRKIMPFASSEPEREAIRRIQTTLGSPEVQSFATDWIDEFLPSWCRLCWRLGLVDCRLPNGDPIKPHHLKLTAADAQIPWHLDNMERPDLRSAACLLAGLEKSTTLWDYRTFPGALLNKATGLLALPIPACPPIGVNYLAGLRPHIEALMTKKNYIKRVKVIPITMADGEVVSQATTALIKETVANLMNTTSLAQSANIDILSLENL